MKQFNEWLELYNNKNFYEFNNDESGVVWLKIKSLIRKEVIGSFLKQNKNITLNSTKVNDQFKELYDKYLEYDAPNQKDFIDKIDSFLKSHNDEIDNIDGDLIKSELYKLDSYKWGGDATNSLDKLIVSYVKNHYKYDGIIDEIDNNIAVHSKNYTLNSWYNNWSSILIERIFKSHSQVIPSVGKIKSVDFFIDNIPFDLKVTFFPKGFLSDKRKELGYGIELTILKKLAKRHSISFDKNSDDNIVKYQITKQLQDKQNNDINKELVNLSKQNQCIIQSSKENKKELIKWLYEEQGEMRFGSENRLFLILIDLNDESKSWELKRNIDFVKNEVHTYLGSVNREQMLKNIITFNYNTKIYNAISDAIFIIKS